MHTNSIRIKSISLLKNKSYYIYLYIYFFDLLDRKPCKHTQGTILVRNFFSADLVAEISYKSSEAVFLWTLLKLVPGTCGKKSFAQRWARGMFAESFAIFLKYSNKKKREK